VTRKTLIVLLTCLIICFAAMSTVGASEPDSIRVNNVSLIKVIANPDKFDGLRLRVIGYLDTDGADDSVGIYVSEVDSRNGVFTNSIHLHVETKTIGKMIGRYVILAGVYHAPDPRVGDNGYIDQIVVIKLWGPGNALK
jgi:hypothetical protein